MTVPKKKTSYGILYVQYGKFLSSYDNHSMPKIIKFPTKEVAEIWLETISMPGYMLTSKTTTANIASIHGLDSTTDTSLHNHIYTNMEDRETDKIVEFSIQVANKFTLHQCIKLETSILSATFGFNDNNYDEQERKLQCPDINDCCELYDKSNFTVAEVTSSFVKYELKNADSAAATLAEALELIKAGKMTSGMIKKLEKEMVSTYD